MGENDKDLDEYGVWVTTENEENLSQEFDEQLSSTEETFDFSLDDNTINDIEIDLNDQAVNTNQEEDDSFIDDNENSTSDEGEFIPLELETKDSFPIEISEEEFNDAVRENQNSASFDDFSLSKTDELQIQEDENETYDTLEDNLFENEKESISNLDFDQSENEPEEKMKNEQSDVLQTILAEIKNIKNNIEGIKNEIDDLKREKCQCKDPDEDFFDDDEKISLSSEELDELNDLNISEEGFSEEGNQEEMTLDQELNAKMEEDSFSLDEDPFVDNDHFGIDLEDSDLGNSEWEKEVSEEAENFSAASFETAPDKHSFSNSTTSLEEELNEAKEEVIGSVEDMMYHMDEVSDFEIESKLNDHSFDDLIDTENYNHSFDEKDHFQLDKENEAEENQEISFDLDGSGEKSASLSDENNDDTAFGSISIDEEKELAFEEDLDFETKTSFEDDSENFDVAAKINEELAKAETADEEDLEFEDFTIENLEDENNVDLNDEELNFNPPFETGALEKTDLAALLGYLDNLLDALPDEKIREFANSPYFDLYKKAFKELGIKE